MKIDLTKLTYGFFGACAVAGLTYLGVTKYYEKELAFGENYNGVIKAVDYIDKYYYKDADKTYYERNMISGLLDGLGDFYTYGSGTSSGVESSVNLSMQMKTAGFAVGKDKTNGGMIITEVVPDSNADKLGLCENDIIISIDGKNVRQAGYDNIVRDLLGKRDTTAELVIEHEDETKTVNYVRSVDEERFLPTYSELVEDGILYYRLESFSTGEKMRFKSAYDKLSEEGEINGVVFDLRGNVGGVISESVAIFDLFAPEGSHVVCESVKTKEKEVHKTTNETPLKDVKVAVLVSEETLSSGEILAALFSNTGRGTVIGTQTGGKGVFQESFTLSDMSTYSIVSGYYYVNDVPNYNGVGITPDIVMEMEKRYRFTDDDTQLEKAIELLS